MSPNDFATGRGAAVTLNNQLLSAAAGRCTLGFGATPYQARSSCLN
jgi:hypothetical protein